MSEPTAAPMEWDIAYRQEAPPPWSIGRPQPELAALIDTGKVRSDVLDAGCGEAALSLELAARGYTVVGLDGSVAAVAAAAATAGERGLSSADFAQADVTDFGGYDGRFATIMDSGLFHALAVENRVDYLRCIDRAAAPGAGLFILAFASHAFGDHHGPGPNGFTEEELRQTVSTVWEVDEVRPAKLYANDIPMQDGPTPFREVERDGQGHILLPGFLLSAHKRQ